MYRDAGGSKRVCADELSERQAGNVPSEDASIALGASVTKTPTVESEIPPVRQDGLVLFNPISNHRSFCTWCEAPCTTNVIYVCNLGFRVQGSQFTHAPDKT